MANPSTVTLDDIRSAAARLAGQIERTPCSRSRTLSVITGATLWLKFENLQFTASFKERGAYNKLASLTPEERPRGVIAMSAGNHAQGVAYHARRLGIPATIVMPRNTRVEVDVRENRDQVHLQHRGSRGIECIGRHDDLVPRFQSRRHQSDSNRDRAIDDSDAMPASVHRRESALELFDLTLDDPRHRRSVGRLREIARAREVLVDFLAGSNEYRSTGPALQRYFDAYAVAARRAHGA